MINIISALLIILSILVFLYTIIYYKTYSPEFVTHEQFYTSISGVAFAFFSAILGIWVNVSNKLTDFAKDLGEIKGKLNHFLENDSKKGKK